MIDPNNITKFNQTTEELEEVLLFWVCAAGKNALNASKGLDKLLSLGEGSSPFDKIKSIGIEELPLLMKECGIGCYNTKSRSMWGLVNSNLDLHNCSPEDLENIYGIGRKTSRCFIIHSREAARYAGLDTHILKYLKDVGYDVPKSTPNSKKKYEELEALFIKQADQYKMSIADFDLFIWRQYANNPYIGWTEEFVNMLDQKAVGFGVVDGDL